MLGLASFSHNVHSGNYGSAAIDAVGIAVDAVATAAPIVPGGVGTVIQSRRAVNSIDTTLDVTKGPIYVTPKGVAVTSETLAKQGTSHLAGNFRGLAGGSTEEIISRIPRDWTMVPQDRGAGIKFLDAQGYERIRLHGPSARAPAGSNSASGWTMRIMDRVGNYYDNAGKIVPYRANTGHIPIRGNPNAQ